MTIELEEVDIDYGDVMSYFHAPRYFRLLEPWEIVCCTDGLILRTHRVSSPYALPYRYAGFFAIQIFEDCPDYWVVRETQISRNDGNALYSLPLPLP